MSQSEDYKLGLRRGYSRGYSAGTSRKWPEYRPIVPPDPIVAQLVTALQRLRDGVDNELAMFGPDDEIQERLGPRLDEATEALAKLGKWVVEPETAK